MEGILEYLEGGIKAARSAAEDKERRSAYLEKWCRLTEEFISSLKSRDKAEGGLVQNMSSGRHHCRVGGRVRDMAVAGGTCPGPSYRYDSSGRCMEGQERVYFFINFPPWGWYRCLLGGGVQRNRIQDRTGHRN